MIISIYISNYKQNMDKFNLNINIINNYINIPTNSYFNKFNKKLFLCCQLLSFNNKYIPYQMNYASNLDMFSVQYF